MNILIADWELKQTLSIIRHLWKEWHNIYLLWFVKISFSSLSKYCKKNIIFPKYDDKKFLNKLLNTIKDYNIDLIIPVWTNSHKNLVPLKEKISKYAQMVTVDEKKLNFCLSKRNVYEYAENIWIKAPKTYYPQNFKEIKNIKNNISYPAVIKWLYEVWWNIVDYAKNKDELEKIYINLCNKYDITVKKWLPMIQEYITWQWCWFFAVYNNGKCWKTFQHLRIREMPPSWWYSVASESYKNKLVEKYWKKLLDSLEWHWAAMVEFKLNNKWEPVLIEINPKFWWSLDLALEAWVNFPGELLKIAKWEKVNYWKEYKYPLRFHWPLFGDVKHGFMNFKNMFSVIKDCFNPKVKSNIWLKDPLPNIYEFWYFIFDTIIEPIIPKKIAQIIKNKLK